MSKGRKPKPKTPTSLGPLPECPIWMDEVARAEWARVVPELSLTAIDLVALEAYCQTYARWRQAEERLDKDGIMAGLRKHPAASISDAALKQLRGLIETLGFSPASRGRLDGATVAPTEKDDALDNFIAGRIGPA